ncbi:hypothetical protein B0J17DRAFT_716493 [Rhizoctonia solani]|nr:hypothetical protein B0J17DRAFT_716493 [Rhizoctonia solani]
MKIAVRTLQKFDIEAEPQHTVIDLKQKIGGVQGHPAEHLKLFYSGRSLTDDWKSVESLNIKENDYIMVMVVVPRTNDYEAPKANTGTSLSSTPPLPTFSRTEFTAPVPPTSPTPPTNSMPSTFSSSYVPKHTPTPSTAPQNSMFNSNTWMSGSSTLGSVSEDSVNNLVDMGFERDQVVKALKASFGNADRAVEYLTTGVPENLGDEPRSFSSNPFASNPFSSSAFSSDSFSSNPFSSRHFSSSGPGSAFGPFGMPDMSSSFMRPRPTEMVGHIEEVDPDQPEEPLKPVESESPPPSPIKPPMEDVIPSDPTPSAAVSTPPLAALNDTSMEYTPAQTAFPTPAASSIIPFTPSPFVPEPSSSIISRPIPSTSSFASTSFQPIGFSESSTFGESGRSSGGESVTLESLQDDPMVQNIRELAGQNPELIGPLLEQLIQSKPQVTGLMSSNPQGLAMLLGGGESSRFQAAFGGASSSSGGSSGMFGGGSSSMFRGGEVTLESLENDPIVQQIRELDGGNPELLKALLAQLVQSKPQVAGLMATNPAGLAMLFCGRSGSSRSESHTVSVTREKKEALDRLESFGFSRAMVIQAYFAFDKNEELAANYLVENCADDD